MKKLILGLALLMISTVLFAQATPSAQVRVATATTDFGVNVSIGTTVYCIATDKYYVCKAATESTSDLTDAAANFTQVGGAGLGGTVTTLTGSDKFTITNPTTTPHISPNVGIAKDSLVKMDSLAIAGQWAKFGTKGLIGRSSASVYSELGVKTAIVQDFEQAADSISANRCIFQLSKTPVAGTISVQLNGVNLKPTTQYTIVETNKLRIGCAVYKYDQVSISYSY
jgi:hypothetical protein